MRVIFRRYSCVIQWGHYLNGQDAIQLVDDEDGGPVAKATVSVPGFTPAGDEILIKDWSENEGMVEALVKAGLIEPAHREVPAGFTTAKLCRLTSAGIASRDGKAVAA